MAGAGGRSADEQALRDLLAALETAWNAKDAEAWAACFTADAEFVNTVGSVFQGRETIRARHRQIFATVYARVRYATGIRQIRLLGPDAAMADVDVTLSRVDIPPPGQPGTDVPSGPLPPLNLRKKHVFSRGRDGWAIVATQCTAVLPDRAGPFR